MPYEENYRLTPYYEKLDKLRPNLKQDNAYLYYLQAAAMDFDEGVAYLFNHLKQNKLLDNTLVVFYSDHYAFYYNLSHNVKNINITDIANIEVHRVPMIMYSKTLGGHVNTDFVSSFNIVPTILDLTGIGYQTHYYPGSSVFSDEIKNSVFISKTGGMFNKSVYSDDGLRFLSPAQKALNKQEIDIFLDKVEAFYDKQEQIDAIYKFDIFNVN